MFSSASRAFNELRTIVAETTSSGAGPACTGRGPRHLALRPAPHPRRLLRLAATLTRRVLLARHPGELGAPRAFWIWVFSIERNRHCLPPDGCSSAASG